MNELTREEIHDAVWKTTLTHLAKSYGIPTHVLTKACDQFDIPRPTPDYWPCRKLGYEIEKTPLPPAPPGTPARIKLEWIPKRTSIKHIPVPRKSPVEALPSSSELLAEEKIIQVAEDFRGAHPLIRQARALLAKGSADNYGLIRVSWGESCANVAVTRNNIPRALLILDAVLRTLDPSGKNAKISEEHGRKETGVRIGSEFVRLKITEQTKRFENKGQEGENKSFIWPRYLYAPTGILTFHIDEYFAPNPKKWSDRKTSRIEDSLDEIVKAIQLAGEALRLHAIERAEEEMRRQEEARKYYVRQRLLEQEEARCRALEHQSEIWEKTDRLRAFIEACRNNLANQGDLGTDSPAKRWLAWATRYANDIDPLLGEYLKTAIVNLPPDIVPISPVELR